VTDVLAAPTVIGSPAWRSAPAAAELVHPIGQFYLPSEGTPSTSSACIRLNGVGWQAICYACVLTSATWTCDETTRMGRWSFTLSSEFVEWDPAGAAIVPRKLADGGVLHQLQSYLLVSDMGWTDDTSPAAPAQRAASSLCVDAATLTVEWVRSDAGCGTSVVDRSSREVLDVTATLEVLAGTLGTDYDTDIWTQRRRSVMLGLAGGAPDAVGEGGCIYLPAAYLAEDGGQRDAGKDYLRRKLVWRPAPWVGDDATAGAAGSPLRIGFPVA
jgi:hypothetical protein